MIAPVRKVNHIPRHGIIAGWHGSVAASESTLHQLSPYIGKIKSSMASSLIAQFTKRGETIYDPFSGSGTVALEAWIAGRPSIANDLNPYAVVLSNAKLFPYSCVKDAITELRLFSNQARTIKSTVDLRSIPSWVRQFFDKDTLREIVAWKHVLQNSRRHFLLACLLGILHHQRPGFLSYPSSHTVPYLRSKRFPSNKYPELYLYRDLESRLEAKVIRAMKRVPQLDFNIKRTCHSKNAATFIPRSKVHAIITSPPYMRSLDYARDNRLRLWCLGIADWSSLDATVSPRESKFIPLMRRCFNLWSKLISPRGYCVIITGDRFSRRYNAIIPDVIARIATEQSDGFELVTQYEEEIPDARRVRRRHAGNLCETILVLRRKHR